MSSKRHAPALQALRAVKTALKTARKQRRRRQWRAAVCGGDHVCLNALPHCSPSLQAVLQRPAAARRFAVRVQLAAARPQQQRTAAGTAAVAARSSALLPHLPLSRRSPLLPCKAGPGEASGSSESGNDLLINGALLTLWAGLMGECVRACVRA